MATFIMMGDYDGDSIKGIAAKRSEQARDAVKKVGGQIREVYALLGEHDLMIVAEFPGIREAMQGSLALTRLTGVGFTTAPAVPILEFDELAKK